MALFQLYAFELLQLAICLWKSDDWESKYEQNICQ